MGRVHLPIEPHGSFRLLRLFSPKTHESVTQNLGLRGYRDLARYVWAEQRFDRRYGVRTEFLIQSGKLDFADSAAQSGSSRYRATPPFCVSESLAWLSRHLGGLENEIMIDYGSGAGRVMILGAEAGFGRVVGVEMSPHLNVQSRENLDRYRAKFHPNCAFEIEERDATTYVPPPDARVFYFFNPFTPEFFERALENIRASVAEHPRDIYLLLFQTFSYSIEDLDLIGSVTGVGTWSNEKNRQTFIANR